jgi:hypothetical protein
VNKLREGGEQTMGDGDNEANRQRWRYGRAPHRLSLSKNGDQPVLVVQKFNYIAVRDYQQFKVGHGSNTGCLAK